MNEQKIQIFILAKTQKYNFVLAPITYNVILAKNPKIFFDLNKNQRRDKRDQVFQKLCHIKMWGSIRGYFYFNPILIKLNKITVSQIFAMMEKVEGQ